MSDAARIALPITRCLSLVRQGISTNNGGQDPMSATVARLHEFMAGYGRTLADETCSLVAQFTIRECKDRVRSVAVRIGPPLEAAQTRLFGILQDLDELDAGEIDVAAFVGRCKGRMRGGTDDLALYRKTADRGRQNAAQVDWVATHQDAPLSELRCRIEGLLQVLVELNTGRIDRAAFIDRCRLLLRPSEAPIS
jgi:hypothetical protein